MLTFLRKIRKSLIESGSARKYFLYAIGEIALVVIGILIALQINNWNQDKQAKRQEEILLTEMVKNLKQDLDYFEQQLNAMIVRKDKVKTLSKLLKNKSLVYHDSLLNYFGAVYGVEPTRINSAIYEDLKSRGFDLVKDDSLRLSINQYFEEAIYRINGYAVSEQSVNQEIKPYYLKHFQDIQFRSFARPIDIAFIFQDIQYRNLVDYRIINLESNQLTHHPWFIGGMKALINDIEKYVAKDN